MSAATTATPRHTTGDTPRIPNGSGGAAILAAAIGCFALVTLALVGDKSVAVKNSLNFYKPTGPLSGVTSLAILLWLIAWAVLEWRWAGRDLPLQRISAASLALLALSILLTFPPIVDLF